MADRTVYGLTHSENGWRMVDQGSCVWVRIPGAEHVSLQIREGQPEKILRAFAADFNAYVEPLRDADSACWTATNSVASSNHLSGTAMDLNWNGADGKTFRFQIPEERAYPPPKNRAVRDLLAFYEGLVFCGGDWSIRDFMHFQLAGNTYGSQNVDRVNDFIRRKIRADGFSTYKRTATPGTPPPPPPPPAAHNALDVLKRATGVNDAKAREILLGVQNGLRDSQCTNVNRIAMWLAQIGHESAGFNATEEYQSGDESTDRWKYKGRTWIQITWRSNYEGLSKWAHSKGIVPTPTYFVDHPKKLAEIQYAGLGPAWYWTVARPQINSLCDKRDLVAVTQAINGGQNGAADRKRRYDMALALGDQLLALTSGTPNVPPSQGDDELSAEAERMIREMYAEWSAKKKGPSRAFLAEDGSLIESPLGFIYNIDGNVWDIKLTLAYLFDVPLALEVVEAVAQNGVYEGSWASEPFNAWLNEFGQEYCRGLVAFKRALVSKLALSNQVARTTTVTAPQVVAGPTAAEIASATAALLPPPQVDTSAFTAALQDLRRELQNDRDTRTAMEVYEPDPAIMGAKTSGERVGAVVDALEQFMNAALEMNPKQREAFNRALDAVAITNGSK